MVYWWKSNRFLFGTKKWQRFFDVFSGQGFGEENLKNEGKFKAAEIFYTDVKEIEATHLKRWLKKSMIIQWDYKNIVKRKGVLKRLK